MCLRQLLEEAAANFMGRNALAVNRAFLSFMYEKMTDINEAPKQNLSLRKTSFLKGPKELKIFER
ncbi:MAG: hypothetical protein CVV55_04695 [Synergistetes bacterium HGW-Synergistetes-2]|nr:MAG: hypothetical protein CVV55_04695 [Synergistetes bacterium HGW-Synergistetes-2]